jgi:sulfotransferase
MFKAQDRNRMRPAFAGFCKRGLEGFYEGLTDKPVCVDKNRTWFHYYDWLNTFYPSPKILICIRDLRAVLSSMEKLFRKNRDLEDPADIADTLGMVSITNRITQWLNGNPVGVAALRLLEAIETGRIRHFHVIRFEDLTSRPGETVRKLYDYLEEPWFEHDFDHVGQVTGE